MSALRPLRLAALGLVATVAACSDPGAGRAFGAPDTAASVLFPDAGATDSGPTVDASPGTPPPDTEDPGGACVPARGEPGPGCLIGGVCWRDGEPHPTNPFHPQLQAATQDAVAACFSTPGDGTKGPGAPCADPSECRSDKCLHLLPGESQRHCGALCGTDADCPRGDALQARHPDPGERLAPGPEPRHPAAAGGRLDPGAGVQVRVRAR